MAVAKTESFAGWAAPLMGDQVGLEEPRCGIVPVRKCSHRHASAKGGRRYRSAPLSTAGFLFHLTQQPINRCRAHGEESRADLIRESKVTVPLHRIDEKRDKGLEPFPTDPIGRLPHQNQCLTHRNVINPAAWARLRSLAGFTLPQQALRMFAVHLCYRNKLVEDPALFQTTTPRVSVRDGCHKFVTCRHAYMPHLRLCPPSLKRSNADEAIGLF